MIEIKLPTVNNSKDIKMFKLNILGLTYFNILNLLKTVYFCDAKL
jgi:hypothetical protein